MKVCEDSEYRTAPDHARAVTFQMASDFAARLIAWQKIHGRHGLPWQNTRDPYRIWLSEIMLQQTQVATVIPYYLRFLESFPDIASLASASEDDVLAHWSGLGYYSRARNLHAAAQAIMERHGGHFPMSFEDIMELPGIGRSTAAAISVFAFGQHRAILDGNVKRVFARQFGIEGYPGEARAMAQMWERAEAELPETDLEAYTQGLMDLGATVCTRSRTSCGVCPVSATCVALATDRVNELPHRKPVKALPLKQTVMLIIQNRGEIMLEKRPSTGVWGGLWCFPEMPVDVADVQGFCKRQWGLDARAGESMPLLTHGFTHFRLDIMPQRIYAFDESPRVAEPGQLWMHPEDALQAAIPTPVRKLLMALTDGPLFGGHSRL
ncbi:MAG TPA: A/G-specific adenine glycosylase [Burkholderiales bacterium]|nr:A/G-specific adenine glycosylase [Burkholderiales bacterium]